MMMSGCQLLGITKLSAFSSSITLTYPKNIIHTMFGFGYRSILDIAKEYKNYSKVEFSPRMYAEKRDELKRLIKNQPIDDE